MSIAGGEGNISSQRTPSLSALGGSLFDRSGLRFLQIGPRHFRGSTVRDGLFPTDSNTYNDAYTAIISLILCCEIDNRGNYNLALS